jgi:hypothetical protein
MNVRIALIVMKATEARLQSVLDHGVTLNLKANDKKLVLADEVETIRADLFIAILELEGAA